MSLYGTCVVCSYEGFLNESIRLSENRAGDVCDDCSDYWLRGEEKCEECDGHGLVMSGDDCPDCDGSGVETCLPGYIEHKIKKGRELSPEEKKLTIEYGQSEAV